MDCRKSTSIAIWNRQLKDYDSITVRSPPASTLSRAEAGRAVQVNRPWWRRRRPQELLR
jgi:hypothetical protein